MTQRVKANLFYRGLAFHRCPVIGDTLYTRTEVVGLKQNSTKPGRAATGLAALRMTTVDQLDRKVLDFYRCAMLPLSGDDVDTGHADDLSTIGADSATPNPTDGWDADAFRTRVPGPHFDPTVAGAVLHSTADVVSSAPELARLSLNIAATHHDWRSGGQRLVYGGHTIGLALAQVNRLLPNLVTILGWESCDHTGPVHEGDTLFSELHVESADAGVLQLRSLVYAARRTRQRRPPGAGLAVQRVAVLMTPLAIPRVLLRQAQGSPTNSRRTPPSRSTPPSYSPGVPRCWTSRRTDSPRRAGRRYCWPPRTDGAPSRCHGPMTST